MKKIIWLTYFALFVCLQAQAQPTVEGAWVPLQKGPSFLAPAQKLAATWGPSIPSGTEFQIEKAYGRWIYGTPAPLRFMKKKDFAPAGWIYSRMLLPHGDLPVLTNAERKEIFATIFYSIDTWKKLHLSTTEDSLVFFNFLESLVLSKKTMSLFKHQDEELASLDWIPAAHAEEKSLGIVGANLDFLQQEFHGAQEEKVVEKKKLLAKTLTPFKIAPPSQAVHSNIVGRYLAYRSLKLPKLSHEEVDASLYLQAMVKRVLDACPDPVQKIWQGKHWHVFRFLHLHADNLPQNSWLQFELPGSYFAVSSKAIDIASNEAELAYLIARPFVRKQRVKQETWNWNGKTWPEDLNQKAKDVWSKVQKAQSTRLSENLDVSDEVEVDLQTMECLARAGYSPDAGITYLKKLLAAKDQSWANWYHEHNIGLQYRMERAAKLLQENKATAKIPAAEVLNKKRFLQVTELWNRNP